MSIFKFLPKAFLAILIISSQLIAQSCPNSSDPLCGRRIDSWNVSSYEPEINNGNTTFKYTLSKISGNLSRFTFGLPSCFPASEIISTKITPSGSAEVLTHYGRTLTNQAPEGIVLKVNSTSNSFTFEFTLKGIYSKAPVNIGVTATDSCDTCGETKILYGPQCPTPLGVCGKSLKADIGVMIDQSKFISDNALKIIRIRLAEFLDSLTSNYAVKAKIGVGSFYRADPGSSQCVLNSQVNKCSSSVDSFSQNYATVAGNEYLYANFRSLLTEAGQTPDANDSDKDTPLSGTLNGVNYSFDYDGFLRSNYGRSSAPYTNTYRSFLGSSGEGGIFATCGEPAVDAALKVASFHLMTGWADPQAQDYILLISSGKFTKKIGDSGLCGSGCYDQTAANAALTEASKAKQSGTKIITLLINDSDIAPLLSCSQEEIANGRTTLQQIASEGLFFESSQFGVFGALERIKKAITTTYTCNGSGNGCGEFCNESEITGPGGVCRPNICPTPTPFPTVTPTATISTQCTTFDVTAKLLAIDTEAHSLERTVRDAARLYEKSVSRSKLSSVKKTTKAAIVKASQLTTNVWTTNWTQIPGKFTSCGSCVKNLSGSVSTMNSVAGDLAKITESLLRKIKTSKTTIKSSVAKLRKRTKGVVDNFISKTSSLPSLSNIC